MRVLRLRLMRVGRLIVLRWRDLVLLRLLLRLLLVLVVRRSGSVVAIRMMHIRVLRHRSRVSISRRWVLLLLRVLGLVHRLW